MEPLPKGLLVYGYEFKKYFNCPFYKVLNDSLIHYGYKYKNGINRLAENQSFNPNGECTSGGFYFTDLNNLGHWIDFTLHTKYIALIEIEDDTLVYIEDNYKFKAEKIKLNLDGKKEIQNFPHWNNPDFCLNMCRQNGLLLRYVIVQTFEIIETAVIENGMALKYVELNKIDKPMAEKDVFLQRISIIAVRHSKIAIKHVKNKYILDCIKECPFVLEHIDNQTDDMILAAIQNNGLALRYVKNHTNKYAEIAVSQNGLALKYVKKQTENICRFAIRNNGHAYRYVIDEYKPLFRLKRPDDFFQLDLPVKTQKLELKGREFKQLYETQFYKVLDENFVHHNHVYIDGLNVDENKFNPSENCTAGGLYFTEKNKLGYWLKHKPNLKSIIPVEIPDDADIYIEKNKFKANKFILHMNKGFLIPEFPLWKSAEFCNKVVQQNGLLIQYVPDELQTFELSKLAVKQNGLALKYIKIEFCTNELFELAVTNTGQALKFIPEILQTSEIIYRALYNDSFAIIYVKKQTIEHGIIAIRQNPFLFKYLDKNCQCSETCELAVKYDGLMIINVDEKFLTEEICIVAIENNIQASQYIKKEYWTENLTKFYKEQVNKLKY